MCGRGRFAILAAQTLSKYAGNAQGHTNDSASNNESSAAESGSTQGAHEDTVEQDNEQFHFETLENISPGNICPVLYVKHDKGNENSSQMVVQNMVWGIIPTYLTSPTHNDHYRMFNKRIESLEKGEIAPYFRTVIQNNRCIVVFDGFYEWKLVAGKKHPHYVYLNTQTPLIMAGIYETANLMDYKTGQMRDIKTFSIITSDACAHFSSLHTRQPVILTEEQAMSWLFCPNTAEDAFKLLKEFNGNHTNSNFPLNRAMSYYPVTPKMTNARYQERDCSVEKPISQSLSSFFVKKEKREESSPLSPIKTEKERETVAETVAHSIKQEGEAQLTATRTPTTPPTVKTESCSSRGHSTTTHSSSSSAPLISSPKKRQSMIDFAKDTGKRLKSEAESLLSPNQHRTTTTVTATATATTTATGTPQKKSEKSSVMRDNNSDDWVSPTKTHSASSILNYFSKSPKK